VSRRLALVFALVLGSTALRADDAPEPDAVSLAGIYKSQEQCFACHSPEGMKSPPRSDMDSAKLATLLQDAGQYRASVHRHVECTLCHGAGTKVYPHAPAASQQISPCSECHAAKVYRMEEQFKKSVHAKDLKDKFTCWSCHDPHIYNIATNIRDPKAIVAQDNTMCIDCHNSDLQFSKFAPVGKHRPNIDRIHEWLPNTKLHWESVRCVECHTPPSRLMSHEVLDKTKAEKNCVSCHTQNSSLRTRLYRHLVSEEQQLYGFVNSVIVPHAYVIGATRNPVLDSIMSVLILLALAGASVHGLLRIAAKTWSRRRAP